MLIKSLPRNFCPECRGHKQVPLERIQSPICAEEFNTMVECPACKGTGRIKPKPDPKAPGSKRYQSKGSKSKTIDAPFIQAALAKKYDRSPRVYLPELRNEVAFDSDRTIDGYAIHLTNKQFLAFEIKISRQDFSRDMDSGKWRDWFSRCSEFYFVTPPGLLESPDTILPPGVGLLEVDSYGNIRKVSYPSVRAFDCVPAGLVCVLAKRLSERGIQ